MSGALHRIMLRGINRLPIFLDEEGKQNLLNRLGGEITEGYCPAYAWVLMVLPERLPEWKSRGGYALCNEDNNAPPFNRSVTLSTLEWEASVWGKKLRVEFV
jgi:hypothetical protein